MTTYACITSVDQRYYDHCGKACIESFYAYWPKDIDLYVYNEDMKNTPKSKRINYVPWKVLEDFPAFANRTTNSHVTKFAKKAYSIIHAFENLNVDRIIWLDADTVTTREVPHHFLELISPDDTLSTHFGVMHEWPSDINANRMSFSCETGFFIANTRHNMFHQMRTRYKQYYQEDLGYNLRRFYDGEVYGAVVAEMEQHGAKLLDLNRDHNIKTPIPRSVIAPYITHYKAGRKDNITNENLLKNIDISHE